MKRYLFLILLVFFITIIVLGNYVMSARITLKGQNLNSKTKESFEIYTSNTILNTEEKLTESSSTLIIENSTQNTTNTEIINEDISSNININNEQSQIIKSNYGFLILPEQVSLNLMQTAESEIIKLPTNVVNAFSSDGWTINLTNDNIATKYFGGTYSNVLGATKIDSKQIIIQNRKSCIRKSVAHEMGHYLDWHFSFPSLRDEFRKIYNQEIDTFKSKISNSSAVRDEKEFFAHTFYYLIKDPSKCTPMAAQYVQNYVNNI